MKKWRSRVTTDGLDRAPHRAFMRAMGLDDEALAKPMIGVVSMKGEQTPCNMTHDFQVDAAKAGISEAGGTPREFTTISVSDGISMNHEGMKFSLLSRELIADSIEAVVHGLAYDALIGFGGCDKTLPGVMMGMIRCNVPSIFIYGGSALPGRFDRFAIVLCLALGWSGAVVYDSITSALPSPSLWLLAIGGILYSIGTLFHVWQSLRFQNAIWHAFVLLAASCHYSAVLTCLTLE